MTDERLERLIFDYAMIVIVAGGIARYRGGVWISETSDATGREIQWEVTHWMPLPPPPDKEAGKQ